MTLDNTQMQQLQQTASVAFVTIANRLESVAAILKKYFETGELNMNELEQFAGLRFYSDSIEGIALGLYVYIKSNGNPEIIQRLMAAINRINDVIEKKNEDGEVFDYIDLEAMYDRLMIAKAKERIEWVERRLAKLKSHLDWLEQNVDLTDMTNDHDQYPDEIDDVVSEYNQRMENFFDFTGRISGVMRQIANYQSVRDNCCNYGIQSLFGLIDRLEIYIARYSDSRTPAQYVADKYREAMENGEIIVACEYYLYDWECQTESERHIAEEFRTIEEECAIPEKPAAMASANNSALFNIEYFSMAHVQKIFDTCNGRQFEEMSPGDMYLILNLQNCPRRMQIRNRETKRVCHLIYVLGEMLPDSRRLKWRKSMCDHLKIEYSFYNKKYKDAGSELVQTRYDKEFSERIDQLKEDFKGMEDAA